MAITLYNGKFILLISFTFITIFSAIAIYFCLPILMSHIIRTQLALSPSSGSFNDWKLNSVLDSFYFYNITNYEDITNEVATGHNGNKSPSQVDSQSSILKLKLKEVGPFTFRQEREKININFDTSNETVVYDQVKRWTFVPELSLAKTIDGLNSTWINHVSIPLAGTTLNSEYSEFIDPIVTEHDLRLFMRHSVSTLLFEGYHDILMENAKGSGQIDVDRFGWLYNQNNSITPGIRVFTGPSNATLDKFGQVDSWRNGTNFNVWHYNNTDIKATKDVSCNQFRLSSAGEFFPPPKGSIISHAYNNQVRGKETRQLKGEAQTFDLGKQIDVIRDLASASKLISGVNRLEIEDTSEVEEKRNRVLSLFMPDLCRVFKLYYNETFLYRGLLVDRYIANRYTYDYSHQPAEGGGDNNENRCFCTYIEATKMTHCPPNGMMDIFNCRKGSPLTISFPHFLFSKQDPTLIPYLNLFSMDQGAISEDNEHLFYMDLESSLNLPVRAQIAIQFNVHYRNEPSLNFTKDYAFLLHQQTVNNNSNHNLNDLYLPQMWFRSSATIDDRNLDNLKFIQNHIKLIGPIVTLIMFACASVLLTMSARLAYNLTYGHLSRTNNKSSMGHDQDSCGSMSGNEDALIDQKQKSYPMQLTENMNFKGENLTKATSSRMANCGDLDLGGLESQPLNEN